MVYVKSARKKCNLTEQKGKKCYSGIQEYILPMVKYKDPVTNNIVLQILNDGTEHEENLQAVTKTSACFSARERNMNG